MGVLFFCFFPSPLYRIRDHSWYPMDTSSRQEVEHYLEDMGRNTVILDKDDVSPHHHDDHEDITHSLGVDGGESDAG